MRQLSTITIKLSLFIIATAGIVAACSMNCGCCDPGKVQKNETAACCTDQVSRISFVFLTSGLLDESAQDMPNACNSCKCNTLPQKESNAVTSDNQSLKIHSTPASVPYRSFSVQHTTIHKTGIVPLNAFSASRIPLRI